MPPVPRSCETSTFARGFSLSLALLTLALASTAAGDLHLPPHFILHWGSAGTTDPGEFNNPRGIAVDPSGRVAVVDSYNSRVQVFNAEGTYQSEFGTSGTGELQFSKHEGIAFDSLGRAFITDRNNHRVQVVNAGGNFVRMWGWGVRDGATAALQVCTSSCYPGIAGSGNGQFNDAGGIVVDDAGNVWVADSGNDRIQKFSSAGVYLGQFGGGSVPLSFPTDIDLDGQGNLIITDDGNYRVQRRQASNFAFVSTWGFGVIDGSAVFQICTSGCQAGLKGTGSGQFSGMTGLAVDRERALVYVIEFSNDRAQIFSIHGFFLGKWGSVGSAEGEFSQPVSVATDDHSYVYVTDELNNRVQKFLVGTLETVVVDSGIEDPHVLLAPPARVFAAPQR
jgi:tripartite motif-containing protein 71